MAMIFIESVEKEKRREKKRKHIIGLAKYAKEAGIKTADSLDSQNSSRVCGALVLISRVTNKARSRSSLDAPSHILTVSWPHLSSRAV